MNLAVVSGAAAPPNWTQDAARETTGGGAGAGAKFTALLGTHEKETAQVEASTKGMANAAASAVSAPIGEAGKTGAKAALDAALAGLVREALGGGGGASSNASGSNKTSASEGPATTKARAAPKPGASVVATTTATAAATTQTPPAAAVATRAVARAKDDESSAIANSVVDAKPDPAASAATLNALVASGFGVPLAAAPSASAAAPTPQPRSAAAPRPNATADRSTPTVVASGGGAVDAGPSTLGAITGGDDSLLVSSVQARAYLGLDSTTDAWAAATAAASVGARAPAAATRVDSGAATPTSPDSTIAKRARTSTDAPAGRAVGPASTKAAEAADAVAGVTNAGKSDDPSGRGDPRSGDAPSFPAASTAASPTAWSTDVPVVVSVPVSLDQLPDVIADAADELTAAANGTSGAGSPASAAQPIKELQIDLAPAELGSLRVTMRLADGKLSVVVAADRPSTLKAIESDRDAIVARLGAAASSLDSLVVQPMRAGAADGAESTGDSQTSNQDRSANGANRDSSAGGQSTSRRDGAGEAWRRQGAASRRGAGDLTV